MVGPLRPRDQAAHRDAGAAPTGEATMMNGSVSVVPDRSCWIGNGPREADGAQGRREAENTTNGPGGTYPRRAAQPTAAPHRRPRATLLKPKGCVRAAPGERERSAAALEVFSHSF